MGIYVNNSADIFILNTLNMEYTFGIDNEGLVRHLYWGEKINCYEDYEMPILNEVSTNDPIYEITNEEFPVYGGLRYKETCLKVSFSDGTRDLVYEYIDYKIDKNELIIQLKDKHYKLEIELHYKVIEELNLIERFSVVKNTGEDNVLLEAIFSGQVHIPHENLNFKNTHGYWGAEQQLFNQQINYGKTNFENRRGISSHNHSPYFILDKNATQYSGEVYYGALKFTGNFLGIIEQTQYGGTLVQLGINPYDFELSLKTNEVFETPHMVIGFTNQGLQDMSHNMHEYAKKYVLRNKEIRPVLYNSWEAMEFEVNSNEQIELAKKAKEIGSELFVVDDGWFGQRHSINDGLGDWYVNEDKFPNGLNELINEVKKLDMKFGIWFEPEMVNPLSKLYKEHPDWIYNFENRDRTTSRGQYVLNMTKPEVEDFVYNMLDYYLSNYDIDYIKWDANRPISEPGAKNLDKNEKSLWLKHIQAIYRIVGKLKDKYSHVLFEACASGGGRIDLGILEYFDDFWTSDNTDAYDRLFIQNSYSYMYPIKAMRAWVTDCPNFLSKRNIPMKFRFHSSMMGTLGVGCNLLKLSNEDIELCKKMIQEYKNIRHIVQDGKFYRLETNFNDNDYKCFEYIKENEILLFIFLPQSKIGHRNANVKLKGLNKIKKYGFEYKGKKVIKSGAYLLNHGIDIKLYGDYDSEIIYLKSID